MKKLLLFFVLLCTVLYSGQTTLVQYQFGTASYSEAPDPGAAASAEILTSGIGSNSSGQPGYAASTGSFAGGQYGGYIRLKILTAEYANITLSFDGNANGGNTFWDVYANKTGNLPAFNFATATGDFADIVATDNNKWNSYSIKLSTANNPSFDNDAGFIYVFIAAYNNANTNQNRVLRIDNLRITGCKIPDAPGANAAQSFCQGAQVSSLVATSAPSNSIEWYSTNTGGTALASTAVLTNNATYYAAQRTACGSLSTARTPVTVTLNPLPASVTVTSASAACGTAVLTASGGSGGVIYFQGTTANGTSTSLQAAVQSVSASGTYYFRARSASGCWGPQGSVTVTVTGLPTSNTNTRYISNVKFVGTLNPDTERSSGYSATGYTNQTALAEKAKQVPGGVINMKVNVTGPSLGTVKGWVDWNRNGAFTDANETIYDTSEGGISVENVVFGFAVPAAIPPGLYTVRLRASATSTLTPCGNLSDGETEDYSIEVIADCAAKITSVTAAPQCGTGAVLLTAAGTSGTTSYRWYTTEFGGTAIAGATTSTYSAENLSVGSHTFYVTALNGSCESVNRTQVKAVVKPVPDITFSQTLQNFCGSVSAVNVSSNGGKEEVNLLEEKFENAAALQFVMTEGGNAAAAGKWQLRNSPFIPASPEYNVLKPALSSGFNGGQFANIITDVRQATNITNYLTVKDNLNSTGFTDMKLEYDLYYFSEVDDVTKNYLKVQYSTNGGTNWTDLTTYIEDIGIPSRFLKQTLNLPAAVQDKTQLKFRFVLFAFGTTNEWIGDIAAVDNVRIYGNKPLSTNFTWGGDTGVVYASDCQSPVPAGGATSVCIKPSASDLENKKEITVTATATLSNGCSAQGTMTITNNSKVWNPSTADTEWNDSKWLPEATPPTADKCVIIKKPLTISAGTVALAKNITIEKSAGAQGKLTVLGSLTVTDGITNTGTDADFIVESGANLMQVNDDAVNSGPATVKRVHTLTEARREYNFVSSPVANQNMKLIFGNNAANIPFVTVLNESTNYFVNAKAADYLIKGKGFAVKEPITSYTGNISEYRGVPNNGTVTLPMSRSTEYRGWHVAGNPYASNIDIVQLYENSVSNLVTPEIDPTFRFWDNRFNATYEQQGGAYEGYSYALFNAISKASTAAPGNDPYYKGSTVGVKSPGSIINVSQGFMVRALLSGASLKFKNSMRVPANTGSEFYGKSTPDNRYRLQLRTSKGFVVQNAVTYIPHGSMELGLEDTRTPNAYASDALYTFAGGMNKVVINGRSSFDQEDVLRLGTRHFVAGTYIIEAVDMEGIFGNAQKIYLKDKVLGIVADLSAGAYTFTSEEGEFNNRFEVIYKTGSVLATDSAVKGNIEVYSEGADFVIRSADRAVRSAELYDTAGRLVISVKGSARELRLNAANLPQGIYMLKTEMKDGEILTKKIRK